MCTCSCDAREMSGSSSTQTDRPFGKNCESLIVANDGNVCVLDVELHIVGQTVLQGAQGVANQRVDI